MGVNVMPVQIETSLDVHEPLVSCHATAFSRICGYLSTFKQSRPLLSVKHHEVAGAVFPHC